MLFKPDGVGLLTIMVLPQPPSDAAVEDQIARLAIGGQDFHGNLRGATLCNDMDGTLTRFWWLACKGRTLLVSYQCSSANGSLERIEVDELLRNISESPTEAA